MTEPKEGEGIRRGRNGIRRAPRRRALWIGVGGLVVVAALVGVGVLAGWFGSSKPSLVGAGATFPYPLINKWSIEYQKVTGVQVNYNSIGSGGGIRQLTQKTVDFGGSDAPLNTTERAAAPNVLHIPETLGAVVFVYNLPGVPTGLNLTGPVIADIFLGKITMWNDTNLTALNPSTNLPAQAIVAAHRSDGSGTTYVWTDYLSKVSPDWASGPGKGKSVQWPANQIGASGNAGVAGVVTTTTYAAGYVELAYAVQQSMTYARVRNFAGTFVLPSLDSTAAAAANAAATLPTGEGDWKDVSIVDPPGTDSYPIASFSYLLVYRELNTYGGAMTQAKAKALVDFLWWAVSASCASAPATCDGQSYATALEYVPLPAAVVTINVRTIGLITYNGQVLHGG